MSMRTDAVAVRIIVLRAVLKAFRKQFLCLKECFLKMCSIHGIALGTSACEKKFINCLWVQSRFRHFSRLLNELCRYRKRVEH